MSLTSHELPNRLPIGYVSEPKAAQILKVSRSSLRAWRVEGRIPESFYRLNPLAQTRGRIGYETARLAELAERLKLTVPSLIAELSTDSVDRPLSISLACELGRCEECIGCDDVCHVQNVTTAPESSESTRSDAAASAVSAAREEASDTVSHTPEPEQRRTPEVGLELRSDEAMQWLREHGGLA